MVKLTAIQQAVLDAYQREQQAGRACGRVALALVTGRTTDSVKRALKSLRRLGLVGDYFHPTTAGELLPPAPAFDLKAPSEEVVALRQKLAEAKNTLGRYRESQGELQEFVRDIVEYVETLSPPEIVYHKPSGKRVSTPIAMCVIASDWHLGATQPADEVEGFNEFSPEILKRRIDLLTRKLINWTDVHRGSYDVDELRILVTGDMISGQIHEELLVTNSYSAPVQCVEAGRLLASMTSALSPHYKEVVVDIITVGNHDRLSKKPQHREAGYNSFGYPMAVITQVMLKDHRNVTVNIHPVEQKVVTVKGRRYLICHGHQMKSWLGIPYYSLSRKIGLESTKRMIANHDAFDLLVCGHFHTPMYSPTYIMGGSASGTDAFDASCGRYSIPCQVSWMLHPRHHEFGFTFWRLDE